VIAIPFRRCVDPPASCGRIPNHFFLKVNFSAYGEIRTGTAGVRARGLSRRLSLAVIGWPLRRKVVAEEGKILGELGDGSFLKRGLSSYAAQSRAA